MYKIIGSRGIGKTRILLNKAKLNNLTVVCKHPDDMRERAYDYGIVGLNIIGFDEFNQIENKTENQFLIQNLNDYLKYLGVVGYTDYQETERYEENEEWS